MNLDLASLASYLKKYIGEYRRQYKIYCSPPPGGGGFPRLDISPYVYAEKLECFLLNNGVVIFSPSIVPKAWYEQAAQNFSIPNNKLALMNIANAPTDIRFSTALSAQTYAEDTGTTLALSRVDEDIENFLIKYTLGFVGAIDINLQFQKDLYYCPHIIRNIGINNVKLRKSKFIPYLEIHTHKEICAWREESIYVRVSTDIRRDFTDAATASIIFKNNSTGSISFGTNVTDQFLSGLRILHAKVDNLQKLLHENPDGVEALYQKELEQNPEIVDFYGKVTSQPQGFKYPVGVTGPDSKTSYIPDFIVEYPNFQWRLIEIEKPNKGIKTKEGHQRSEFTQAMHQIKQWKHLIRQYPEAVRNLYPGITEHCKYTLIIGRNTPSIYGKDLASYKSMLIGNETDIDIFTYDEFIERMIKALTMLESIRI